MSIVSVSLDTKTRACTMTIDGIQVPAQELNMYRYERYDRPGEFEVGFSYTTRQEGANGLIETVSYRLPPQTNPDSSDAALDDRGFIVEHGSQPGKIAADIAKFLAARGVMKSPVPEGLNPR